MGLDFLEHLVDVIRIAKVALDELRVGMAGVVTLAAGYVCDLVAVFFKGLADALPDVGASAEDEGDGGFGCHW